MHVLSPLMNTSVSTLKPNIVTSRLETYVVIEAANKYLSTTSAMVVMDPYEAEAHMRFNTKVFFMDWHLRQILLSTQQLH
jgi:hypothetical protein